MDKDKILNIKIWVVIVALVFGSYAITGTKNDIKDLIQLDDVIEDNSINYLQPIDTEVVTYVDMKTFAQVNLLQIKLMTELAGVFFGFMVLLQLLDEKKFSLINSIKEILK